MNAPKPVGRRVILGLIGLGAVGVVTGNSLQQGVADALRPFSGSGLNGLIPGGGSFVIYTVTSGYPAPPRDYKVRVGGKVAKPQAYDLSQLKDLPAVKLDKTFHCVTGWEVSNVHWVGVRLTDLIDRSAPEAGAGAILFTSFDGIYTECLTREQAVQSGAIVAYEMLGEPITREHGGPVRLYVPEMFGYKSIKWLSSIELIEKPVLGYWEHYGYPQNAWISGSPPIEGAA